MSKRTRSGQQIEKKIKEQKDDILKFVNNYWDDTDSSYSMTTDEIYEQTCKFFQVGLSRLEHKHIENFLTTLLNTMNENDAVDIKNYPVYIVNDDIIFIVEIFLRFIATESGIACETQFFVWKTCFMTVFAWVENINQKWPDYIDTFGYFIPCFFRILIHNELVDDRVCELAVQFLLEDEKFGEILYDLFFWMMDYCREPYFAWHRRYNSNFHSMTKNSNCRRFSSMCHVFCFHHPSRDLCRFQRLESLFIAMACFRTIPTLKLNVFDLDVYYFGGHRFIDWASATFGETDIVFERFHTKIYSKTIEKMSEFLNANTCVPTELISLIGDFIYFRKPPSLNRSIDNFMSSEICPMCVRQSP